MSKVRGFKVAKGWQSKRIVLPRRATKYSAGYDFRAAETVTIPSYVQNSWAIGNDLNQYGARYIHPLHGDAEALERTPYMSVFKGMENTGFVNLKPRLVHTGVTMYCPHDEALEVFNRSSNPIKRGLYLCNGVGVIDSDYAPHEIMAEMINLSPKPYTIHRGDRIMQGVFVPYLLADGDTPVNKHRNGGLGSTGK